MILADDRAPTIVTSHVGEVLQYRGRRAGEQKANRVLQRALNWPEILQGQQAVERRLPPCVPAYVILCATKGAGFDLDEGTYREDMKSLDEIKQILHEQKPYLAERYGVVQIGVFGSYVRNEQQPDSDIDILIELEQPPRVDLFDLVHLEYYLGDLLGVKVDIAIKGSLRKRIGQRIVSEVVPV